MAHHPGSRKARPECKLRVGHPAGASGIPHSHAEIIHALIVQTSTGWPAVGGHDTECDMKKWSAAVAPAGRVAYVNGRYLPHPQAGVHIEDRALQLGDGIYEVFNVLDGVLLDEEGH